MNLKRFSCSTIHECVGSTKTAFYQINAFCALTATLVNSEGPEEYYRSFQLFLLNFAQFLPILREIVHQKMPGARLFRQGRLFGEIRYMYYESSDIVFFYASMASSKWRELDFSISIPECILLMHHGSSDQHRKFQILDENIAWSFVIILGLEFHPNLFI